MNDNSSRPNFQNHSRILNLLMAIAMVIMPSAYSANALENTSSVPVDTELEVETNASDALKQILENARVADKIPGLTFVVFNKKGVITRGEVGQMTMDPQSPAVNSSQSIFRIGSVAKLFTSLATSKLIQEGRISRNSHLVDLHRTDVVQILNRRETEARLKQWEEIKIHHLMSHQAGISKDISGSLLGFNSESLKGHSYPTMDTFFRNITSVEFLFPAGQIETKFKYSNLAVNILSRVVEAYNPWHLSYSSYVSHSILRPLGMRSTYYDVPINKRDMMVYGYGSLLPDGTRIEAPQAFYAGSYEGSMGVATTARDLAKLGMEMLKIVYSESKYLTRSSVVKDWLTIKSPGTPSSAYASGPNWLVLPGESANDDIWFGHQGTGASERAALLLNAERNLGVAILFNCSDAGREKYVQLILKQLKVERPELFAKKVPLNPLATKIVANARTVLAATKVFPNQTPPPYPKDLDVKKYVGKYYADLAGTLPLTFDEGTGYLIFMGQKLAFESEGRFRMPSVGAPATNTNREPIVFSFDEAGKVTSFKAFNIAIFRRVE